MIRGKITAWISIDHDVLPESETRHELGKAICWIPSKAGAPFRIGYTAHNRGYDLRVSVYIDGELVAEQTHAPRRGRVVTSDGIRGRKDDSGTERPFLFKERSITDNDMDVVSEAQLSQLGSIKVTFAWIIADRASLSTRPCKAFATPNSHHNPIYEGQVKRQSSAVAHAAGLGAKRKISPNWFSAKHRFMRNRPTLRPLRWRETTLRSTSFEFKYAPREYLSAEGILECSLPSSPSLDTPDSPRFATHSPWRSHVGTPYRELWDASFTNIPRANARELWLGDSELDFNTPVKLGKHTISNYTPLNKSISHTPLTKLGNHTIAMSPFPARLTPLFKEEAGDTSIVEITADEFYRRDVIDLTGLDSDDE